MAEETKPDALPRQGVRAAFMARPEASRFKFIFNALAGLKAAPRKILAVVLVAEVILAVIWFATRSDVIEVSVAEVGRGRVEAAVLNTRAGSIEACQRTRLSTIVGGRIEYLGVREGDRVQAGQVLMRLWQDDLHASEAVAKAQLMRAHQYRNETCTLAEQAIKEAHRQEELVKNKFVSPNAAEKTRANADSSAAACARAEAEVVTAERQLASIDTNLSRTVIVAPFNGTIARINGELGEISTPSPTGIAMPPAIDLIDDSCLYVRAPMDEVDAPRIRPGQPVRISIEALKDKKFTGKVRRIAPYITTEEKQARTVNVDIDFDDMDAARALLVGYSADVEIVLAARHDALRIPTAALHESHKVLVLTPNGRVARRAVKAGIANWEQTEVLAGLEAGEQVITTLAAEGLVPGARAKVAKSGKHGR